MKLQIYFVCVVGILAVEGVSSFMMGLGAKHCCIQLHLCTEALIVCILTVFGLVM